MTPEEKIAAWAASYKGLADKVVAHQVSAMKTEFPEEQFPVSPPYRKAMYHRLMVIVDELNTKMDELLEESPDETDEPLKKKLMALQEGFEQEFIDAVKIVDESLQEQIKTAAN